MNFPDSESSNVKSQFKAQDIIQAQLKLPSNTGLQFWSCRVTAYVKNVSFNT